MTRAEARQALKDLKTRLHSRSLTYDQYIVQKLNIKRIFKAKVEDKS